MMNLLGLVKRIKCDQIEITELELTEIIAFSDVQK